MLMGESVNIRPMKKKDQDRCQNLIYCGLREHFGTHFNTAIRQPDLEDIAEWYRNETFLVAEIGDLIVGTGALIQEAETTGRIVRMSVARKYRRKGIGTRVLDELKHEAKRREFERLAVETTSSWKYVVDFYKTNDFKVTGHREKEGETDFRLDSPW